MEDTINRIPEVYSIFVDFFGEEYVDLQDDPSFVNRKSIIVHFPKVKVTNEHDKSVDITHLWVKVVIDSNGLIYGLNMMRSEYTDAQFLSGYAHSHIPPVDKYSYKEWESPCLGSGPIRSTFAYLCSDHYPYSEDMWRMFCLELSKYVTVESLAGGPYKYLENIGIEYERNAVALVPYIKDVLAGFPKKLYEEVLRFIPFVISKKPFKFNFKNGAYGIALSNINKIIILSNLYIEFYNSLPIKERIPKKELFDYKFLNYVYKVNNKFYYKTSNFESRLSDCYNLIGNKLFTFKGNPVTFNIIKDRGLLENSNILLSSLVVKEIINRILMIVNVKYGRADYPVIPEEGLRYL